MKRFLIIVLLGFVWFNAGLHLYYIVQDNAGEAALAAVHAFAALLLAAFLEDQ